MLYLDIQKTRVVGVTTDRKSKVNMVTGCVITSLHSTTFEEALTTLLKKLNYGRHTCFISLGAELLEFRNITIPFTDTKKIAQVLPFQLEGQYALPIENLHYAYTSTPLDTHSGNELLVAMLPKEKLDLYLSTLQSQQLVPEFITIAGLAGAFSLVSLAEKVAVFIDFTPEYATIFLLYQKKLLLIRSLPLLQSPSEDSFKSIFLNNLKQTLVSSRFIDLNSKNFSFSLAGYNAGKMRLLLQNAFTEIEIENYSFFNLPELTTTEEIQLKYRPESMDRAVMPLVCNVPQNILLNFGHGTLKKEKFIRNLKKYLIYSAVPVVILAAFLVFYLVDQYTELVHEKSRLTTEVDNVFKETLPDIKRIVNPVQQLQIENKYIKQTYQIRGESTRKYTIINLLTEISSLVPKEYSLKIIRFVADINEVIILAETGDFKTIHNVKKALEKSGLFAKVEIDSANQAQQTNTIKFQLRISLAN